MNKRSAYKIEEYEIVQTIRPVGKGNVYGYICVDSLNLNVRRIEYEHFDIGHFNKTIPLIVALMIYNQKSILSKGIINSDEIQELLEVIKENPECFGFVEENNMQKALGNKLNQPKKKIRLKVKSTKK